jgi:hypothetical protein
MHCVASQVCEPTPDGATQVWKDGKPTALSDKFEDLCNTANCRWDQDPMMHPALEFKAAVGVRGVTHGAMPELQACPKAKPGSPL